MQITKQTTNKTIIDHSSTKTSLDSTWYGRRLRQKTSRKSSSALYFRRLPINLPKSDPDLKNMYIKLKSEKHVYQTQIWKTCISKNVQWLKKKKISGKLDIYFFIEHKKYISKWKMRIISLKTCNKKKKILVRKTWDKNEKFI